MQCRYCPHLCVKNGVQKNGKQKYYCSHCKKHQQNDYTSQSYQLQFNE